MRRHGLEGRRRLQQAALELFAEHGYGATSVAAIAARAGLTERTFFRHFADKREVLFADGDVLAAQLAQVVRQAPAGKSARSLAWIALQTMADELEPRREELRDRHRVIASNPELQERDILKQENVVAAVARAMHERGLDEAQADLAASAAGAILRVGYRAWLNADRDHTRTLQEYLLTSAADLARLVPTGR